MKRLQDARRYFVLQCMQEKKQLAQLIKFENQGDDSYGVGHLCRQPLGLSHGLCPCRVCNFVNLVKYFGVYYIWTHLQVWTIPAD